MQAVQENTHVSPQGSTSLIDLALVSEASLLSSCCVIPPLATSDHKDIQCSLKWKTSNPLKASTRKVWRYNLANFDAANHHLIQLIGIVYFLVTSIKLGKTGNKFFCLSWNNVSRTQLSKPHATSH